MPIPAWLSTVLQPVADTVTKLVTIPEQRAEIRLKLLESQVEMTEKYMDITARLAESQERVIVAEAQGNSWLQRNWRPTTMMVFVSIIAWNFIVAPIGSYMLALWHPTTTPPPLLPIPDHMWTLLEIGIGGYIAGRSVEKIVQGMQDKQVIFTKRSAQDEEK